MEWRGQKTIFADVIMGIKGYRIHLSNPQDCNLDLGVLKIKINCLHSDYQTV